MGGSPAWGLPGRYKERGGWRCSASPTTRDAVDARQLPCARRVATPRRHLLRWSSSTMTRASPSSDRLASTAAESQRESPIVFQRPDMAIVHTEAFVLKAFRYGETSMIYRLLTRDRGVVPVIARGARSPRSRLGAAVNAFRRLDVTYYDKPGREIQTLSQAEVVAEHREITSSLEKLDVAG